MLSGSFGVVVDCPLGKVREHTERALETAGAFSHPGVFQRRWFFPQIEQWYIPGWLSITANVTGDFGMAPSQILSSLHQTPGQISDRGHRSVNLLSDMK